jgi:hypothetical protein
MLQLHCQYSGSYSLRPICTAAATYGLLLLWLLVAVHLSVLLLLLLLRLAAVYSQPRHCC